jgi:kynurenine formamidase
MCSPKVAQVVSERFKKEGLPSVSRRNFLKLGGLASAAGVVASTGLITPARVRADSHMSQVMDLTHVFGTSLPTYDKTATPAVQDVVTVAANGFYIQQWTFGEHTGTHVDIPAHFIADGETVDIYNPQLLVSPAVVIDISARAETEPEAMVTVDDILAWESANGDLPVGALVCMYSGWETRWSDIEAFRNEDGDGVMRFPAFSPEAAAFLVEQRDIHGIAVDTLSLDIGSSSGFDVHYTILGAGKYGVENVANLRELIGKPANVIVGVNRWENGSGGPARVLAMVGESM